MVCQGRAKRLLWMCTVLAVPIMPGRAAGQTVATPETAPVQFWQFGLTPRVSIVSGIDTNVFNEAESSREDLTSTVTTDIALSWRAGRVRFGGSGQHNYLYFREFARERSSGGATELRAEVPINRVTVYAAGSYLNTRERPGLEIDERARRVSSRAGTGLQIRLMTKTSLDIDASRSAVAFADSASTSLREALNHESDTVNVGVRYALTPLTTLRLRGEAMRDRFEFSPLRDADSVRVMSGVDLAQLALISGQVLVGFRRFAPSHPEVRRFAGFVASVGVGYTWRSRTRLSFDFNRDLNYATDPREPYYVFNDLRSGVTVHITDKWDATAAASRQLLDYREREGVASGIAALTVSGPLVSRDQGQSYTAGAGYRINPLVRIGVDARYFSRQGTVATRTFEGWRLGTSVTYGR